MTAIGPRFGRFCWVDLAAAEADRAKAFYGGLFGWKAREQVAGAGRFTRLQLDGEDVGSLYQLGPAHLDGGVPSHWTPYVCVASADRSARMAESLGGEVLAPPFDVEGMARVALVLDPVGAAFGLWERIAYGGGGRGRD